jgi:hypothetical protein
MEIIAPALYEELLWCFFFSPGDTGITHRVKYIDEVNTQKIQSLNNYD